MNNSYSELYEAEDANLERSANRNSDHFNYSGSGFVDGYGYMELGSKTVFTVMIPEDGIYKG